MIFPTRRGEDAQVLSPFLRHPGEGGKPGPRNAGSPWIPAFAGMTRFVSRGSLRAFTSSPANHYSGLSA